MIRRFLILLANLHDWRIYRKQRHGCRWPNREKADPENPEHWHTTTPEDEREEYQCRKAYPQTWGLVVRSTKRGRRWRKLIEWLCGKLVGHEVSKTEFGYGGGNMADYHCRWCDRLIQMPYREETSTFRRDLIDGFNSENIE